MNFLKILVIIKRLLAMVLCIEKDFSILCCLLVAKALKSPTLMCFFDEIYLRVGLERGREKCPTHFLVVHLTVIFIIFFYKCINIVKT